MDRKRRIEDAALNVFAKKGYADSSTSEIAKKAEVAEGTIFKHFGTKKKLLLGVLNAFAQEVLAPVATKSMLKILEKDYTSLAELLTAIFDDRAQTIKKATPLMRVFLQEAALHKDVRDLLLDIYVKNLGAPFEALIERMMATGLINSQYTPNQTVRLIMSMFGSHFVTRYLMFPDRDWNDEIEKQAIIKLLCEGLATNQGAGA